MIRLLLFFILAVVVGRVFWVLVDSVIEGMSGRTSGKSVSRPSVQMVRDPICGTFLLPERAIRVASGRGEVFFCSRDCQDRYQARQSRPA